MYRGSFAARIGSRSLTMINSNGGNTITSITAIGLENSIFLIHCRLIWMVGRAARGGLCRVASGGGTM
jgi:hypothetical protein